MNNRDFIVAVNRICSQAIRDGMGYANAYTEVCALVKAESALKAPNTQRDEICPHRDTWTIIGADGIPIYKIPACIK